MADRYLFTSPAAGRHVFEGVRSAVEALRDAAEDAGVPFDAAETTRRLRAGEVVEIRDRTGAGAARAARISTVGTEEN